MVVSFHLGAPFSTSVIIGERVSWSKFVSKLVEVKVKTNDAYPCSEQVHIPKREN